MVMNQIKQSAASILSNVKKQIKLDSIMVCDSALYSQENIQLISNLKLHSELQCVVYYTYH